MVKKQNKNPNSKRMSCRKRYKIQKKVREHLRKTRKDAKIRNQLPEHRRALKRDPGIPNLFPNKEAMLKEVVAKRSMLEKEKKMKKDNLKRLQQDSSRHKEKTFNKLNNDPSDIKLQDKYAADIDSISTHKAFYKEFRQVVDASDIVIEVLDARDPLSCRNKQAETLVTSNSDRRLVLLLNKADLIPREVLAKWLSHLRKEHPTIAFKSSTQSQKSKLGHKNFDPLNAPFKMQKTSACLGATTLLHLLRNYTRLPGKIEKGIKKSIIVGVIGCPNVGKSSVINSIVRNRSCHVGAVPGMTKVMAKISLDKHIKLLDCPGLFPLKQDNTNCSLTLLGSSSANKDPLVLARNIYQRCHIAQLMDLYKLPEYSGEVDEFLAVLATKHGKLKKGGYPDMRAAAKLLVQDSSMGKIRFYKTPPESEPQQLGSLIIVGGWSNELDIESLIKTETEEMHHLQSAEGLGFELGLQKKEVNTNKSDIDDMSD